MDTNQSLIRIGIGGELDQIPLVLISVIMVTSCCLNRKRPRRSLVWRVADS